MVQKGIRLAVTAKKKKNCITGTEHQWEHTAIKDSPMKTKKRNGWGLNVKARQARRMWRTPFLAGTVCVCCDRKEKASKQASRIIFY